VAAIDVAPLRDRMAGVRVQAASDVDNPLLGPEGAAAIFGPQKGATPADVGELDAALANFVQVLATEIGPRAVKAANAPGAGAAGGVGYAAIAALAASRRPGIDVVLEFTRLAERLEGADLVITGEGSLDEQSLLGKTPMGVARAAAAARLPVLAVCGRTTLSAEQQQGSGFRQVYPLTALESRVEICIAEAGRLLEELGQHIGVHLTDSVNTKEPLNV
jgi:glycerate kinase